MSQQPVFILACSPRSGSTWLQRIITSTREVMVWGESGYLFPWGVLWSPGEANDKAVLNHFAYESHYKAKDLIYFREKKADMWMAVLNPTFEDAFHGHKIALKEIYGKAAKKEGYERWGMKETAWSNATVHFLSSVFPKAKVIFLTRKFEDSWWSRFHYQVVQNATHENDINIWCEAWIKQHNLALEFVDKLNAKIIHYEDLCEKKNAILDLLKWIGCKNPLDPMQCGRKISSHEHNNDPMSTEDEKLLLPYKKEIDDLSKRIREHE